MDWLTSIKDIRRAQENNQLVVFVGAGVSKNSNVPTWWELIKRIADEIKYDNYLIDSKPASEIRNIYFKTA